MQIQLYQKMYQLEQNNWWFKARRKIFLSLIKDLIKDTPHPRVLDAGCGTGVMLQYLNTMCHPTGIDISREALKFCRLRGLKKIVWGNAEKLPFNDNSFDLVLALDTIEHVKQDQKALSEFTRVLRPGGHLLVSVPALPILWSSHDVVHQHHRRYSKKELALKIQNSKMRIKKISFINTILFPPAFFFRFLVSTLNKIGVFRGHTDLIGMPSIMNEALYLIFGLESLLLKITNLPIGITLLAIAQKTNENRSK